MIKSRAKSVALVAINVFMISVLSVITPIAMAEACPENNLEALFREEYYGNVKWDNRLAPRVITWSTAVTSVSGTKIEREFTATESQWLQASFDSWDIALDTISFRQSPDAQSADILIGLVAIQNYGFWTVQQRENFRGSGTIQLTTTSPFLSTRNGFIEVAQSEIGNLLGLGDIAESADVDSVMKDPDTAPYGSIPLSDFDIDLIRQFYGESTCHSAWPQSLKDSKAKAKEIIEAADAAALTKAAAEAQAKLDDESRITLSNMALAAEVARKAQEERDRAEIAAFQASLRGKKTITCVKGKIVKKVIALSPKCPVGYKKT